MGAVRVELNELSERFAALRSKGKRPRISRELKTAVLNALESGASVQQVAASCGLNPVQVYHWRATFRRGQETAAGLVRRVAVMPPLNPLKITFPGGASAEFDESQVDLILKLIRGLA